MANYLFNIDDLIIILIQHIQFRYVSYQKRNILNKILDTCLYF